MTTLYIDRNNLELRLEGGALTCYEDGQRVGTIPTAPLERVVMRGTAKVETQAIAKLGSLDVGSSPFSRRAVQTLSSSS